MEPKLFDHTILAADATKEKVQKVIDEAKDMGFASVCVNSYYAKTVSQQLKGTGVLTTVVVGFPLGMMHSEAKAFETKKAVEDGADEIDMVINVGALKDRDTDKVLADIQAVRNACPGKTLKVIIECCLLTEEEMVLACELSEKAGADFVKTSTGFSKGGAKAEDVALMRKTVGNRLGVKASGGIHNATEAQTMVDAGASRLGTSATMQIMNV